MITTDWQYYMNTIWNAPFEADNFGKEEGENYILTYSERVHGPKG